MSRSILQTNQHCRKIKKDIQLVIFGANNFVNFQSNSRMWFIITHSILQIHTEKQYDPATKIGSLKDKLVPIVGTNPSYMKLELRDSKSGKLVAHLSDDNKTLQDYNAADYMNIHVVDTDPNQSVKSLTDTSQVKKYVMSDEDYDKREDTFRKWKQKHIKQEKKQV